MTRYALRDGVGVGEPIDMGFVFWTTRIEVTCRFWVAGTCPNSFETPHSFDLFFRNKLIYFIRLFGYCKRDEWQRTMEMGQERILIRKSRRENHSISNPSQKERAGLQLLDIFLVVEERCSQRDTTYRKDS